MLAVKGVNFYLLPKKLKFENSPLPIELMYKDVLNDKENKGELIHLKINIKTILTVIFWIV